MGYGLEIPAAHYSAFKSSDTDSHKGFLSPDELSEMSPGKIAELITKYDRYGQVTTASTYMICGGCQQVAIPKEKAAKVMSALVEIDRDVAGQVLYTMIQTSVAETAALMSKTSTIDYAPAKPEVYAAKTVELIEALETKLNTNANVARKRLLMQINVQDPGLYVVLVTRRPEWTLRI
ncbi:hypothetical protein ACFL31_04435 [Candidatus Margulisiibacteriota bacterium]